MRAFLLMAVLSLGLIGCCGYRLNDAYDPANVATVSVPYVEGDLDGRLTAAIIKEISASGAYLYRTSGGELTLYVRILDDYDENIGFRYDRHRDGKLKHEIIPVETREYIVVEVELVDNVSCCTTLGPVRLQANFEFDHDYYIIRNGVNTFSLGQLTDVDSARDAVTCPLYKKLAEKIVDYVIYGW